MGIRKAHDARGASAQEPAHAGQGDPGTRPDAHQVGEAGEDADTTDQDERQEWADGGLQDPGKGFGPHATVYREILCDAQPATKDIIAAPGTEKKKRKAENKK